MDVYQVSGHGRIKSYPTLFQGFIYCNPIPLLLPDAYYSALIQRNIPSASFLILFAKFDRKNNAMTY